MSDRLTWQSILRKDRPLMFGILNCTPDSFSDGGQFTDEKTIVEKINDLVLQGSDVIDFGAESTRPGAKEISSDEQLLRIRPVLENLNSNVLFSVDTRSADVAEKCVSSGIQIVNDVSGGRFDEGMLNVISETDSLCVLMHMRGNPETMNNKTTYNNIVDDVCFELSEIVQHAIDFGISENSIMLDPGIGFAKTPEDSLGLVKNAHVIKERLGFPLLVGLSRKSFLAYLFDEDPKKVKMEQKEWATHYLSSYLFDQGIDALRIHNPLQSIEAMKFLNNFLRK